MIVPDWIKELEEKQGREFTIEEVSNLIEYGTTNKDAIEQAWFDEPGNH